MSAQPASDARLAEMEKNVKAEFGKPFDAEAAVAQVPEIRAVWSAFDLKNKTCLDVGSGHPTVPAVLTAMDPTVTIDAVDLSPDFEREAGECVKALGGDAARIRLVTGTF
ncbi:MAG: hypothetical protein M5R36_19485 [Deltaproteobacteria bacterium]|nr:hypothetical protein [Deltaproteobacteria bacterium]